MTIINQFKSVLLTVRNALLDGVYWSKSRQEFGERFARVQTLPDAVNLLFAYRGGGFYKYMIPNQDRGEITTLVERVAAIQPKVIVEIGTRDGGTLFLWSQTNPDLQLLVSIDLPGGIHGGGYAAPRGKLYQLFISNRPKCQLELLRADSQAQATRARLVELLAGRPIDFLFIDGDHRYPGVRRDYELYADLVRPGGLIALHDIRPNAKDESIQVYQLWDELKAREPHAEEIIHAPYTGRYGIGLITKMLIYDNMEST